MTELVSKSLDEYEDEIFFFNAAKSEAQFLAQTTLNKVKQKAKCLVPLDNVVKNAQLTHCYQSTNVRFFWRFSVKMFLKAAV